MNYATDDDPYIDSKTGVFRNLLGITNADKLAKAEADITAVAIASLAEQPVIGNFDLAHITDVHKYLFGSIYP